MIYYRKIYKGVLAEKNGKLQEQHKEYLQSAQAVLTKEVKDATP